MPESWRDLARSSRTAAVELFLADRWRSSASRGYYAAYSEVTHALLAAGVTMPATQNNPKHKSLPIIVGQNLTLLGTADRWRLAGIVANLYRFRVIADYLPTTTLTGPDARVALGLMQQSFYLLRNVP